MVRSIDASYENGTDEDNETAPDRPDHAGPPSDMPDHVPDHVSHIHQLINSFLAGTSISSVRL